MICPDAQGFIRQQRPYIFEQQLVLEDSPRQNDGVEAVFMAKCDRAIPQTRGNASLEGTRDLSRVPATQAISDHALQQRPEIQLHTGEGKGIRFDDGQHSAPTVPPTSQPALQKKFPA